MDYISALVDPTRARSRCAWSAKNPNDVLQQADVRARPIHSRRDSTGLLAPVSAVLRDDENLPVRLSSPSPTAASRAGASRSARGWATEYEITAGLTAGDQVVVEGGLFLQFAENQ